MESRHYIGYNRSSMLWCHLGALLTMTAWGVAFIATKVLLDSGLNPVEIYVYRFTLAYILLLIVNHKRLFANSLRDEFLFLVCGLCAGSIYFIAENTALEYTLVSNVALITTTSPLLTTFIIALLYKSERPSRGVVVGSLVAFSGVACVIFNSSFVVKMNPMGDILSLAAALSWAVYSIVLRKLNALYSVMFISRKTFFYGIITALPFLLFEPQLTSPAVFFRLDVTLNLLFLGVFASMIAFAIWAHSVKRLGAVRASNYMYVSPIVTLVASYVFLHEEISIVGYVGCALIMVGVFISDRLSKKI